jgi:hypothetical protein
MVLKLFERLPEHPLAARGEAERLVQGLPRERPADAVAELAHWLASLAQFDGFACDHRLDLVETLDAAGQSPAAQLFAELYAHAHQRDRAQRKRFGLIESYWESLAGAYRRCVIDNERGERRAAEIKEKLPLALARAYRASFHAARARCLMYLPASPKDWAALYRPLAFAELARFAATPVRLYEREVRSTARAELTKLLAFVMSAPHELPPAQVDLAARILERFAVSFAWAEKPGPGCACVIDVAAGGAPRLAQAREAPQGRRYFGAGPALAKLQELEQLSARDLLSEEMRFGADFPPTLIVTVIRHLLRYLGPNPPRRQGKRVPTAGKIDVVRGFRAICQRVIEIEAKGADDLSVQAEEASAPPETWQVLERSEWGVGAQLAPGVGNWTEPGVLCGLRDGEGARWGVAIIRRLDASAEATRCGLQILSKKPVSVWLRIIGREGQETSNWESSTGSFSYDYTRAIVLADAPKVDGRPVLLLETGKFVPDQICEIVVGEQARFVKLARFLEEGADYLRVAFDWLAPESGSASRRAASALAT